MLRVPFSWMASWGIALYWFCGVFDSPVGVLRYIGFVLIRRRGICVSIRQLEYYVLLVLNCTDAAESAFRFARKGTVLYVLYCFDATESALRFASLVVHMFR